MNDSDITYLHIEATSRCNAWCPSCKRNCTGYGLANITEQDLPLDNYEHILSRYTNVDTIQFCGNYGDPINAIYLQEMIQIGLDHNVSTFQIHTNGSARTVKWWFDLASLLRKAAKHEVIFGIDGSAKTNHLYRQATSWDKIMDNAKAFIDNGGYASWQFLRFDHNLHEEEDLRELSREMGFKKFTAKVPRIKNGVVARNWKTGEPYTISTNYHIPQPKVKEVVLEENCMHLSIPSLYVSSLGNIAPCCYLANRVQYFHNDKYNDIKDHILNNPDPHCLRICGTRKNP